MNCRYSWCPRTAIAEDDRFGKYQLGRPDGWSLCAIHAHADGNERITI